MNILFKTIIALALLPIIMCFLAWILMLLWNVLMPDIFGLPVITYWKSFGLMLLSSLLFKRVTISK